MDRKEQPLLQLQLNYVLAAQWELFFFIVDNCLYTNLKSCGIHSILWHRQPSVKGWGGETKLLFGFKNDLFFISGIF